MRSHAGFVCELDVELGKVHLRLLARRRLETDLEAAGCAAAATRESIA